MSLGQTKDSKTTAQCSDITTYAITRDNVLKLLRFWYLVLKWIIVGMIVMACWSCHPTVEWANIVATYFQVQC